MTEITPANDRLVRKQLTDALTAVESDVSTLQTNLNYASGTWTITIQDDSLSDAEGQTYTANSGTYTRMGEWVFFTGKLAMSSLGTLTTSHVLRIAGIPYAAASITPAGRFVVSHSSGLSLSSNASLVGNIQTGWPYFKVNKITSAGATSQMLISELTASGVLRFSGMYRV